MDDDDKDVAEVSISAESDKGLDEVKKPGRFAWIVSTFFKVV